VRLARASEVTALAEFDRACFGRRAWPLQAWWEAVTEPGWTTVVLAVGPALLGVSALLLQPPVAFLASIAVHPAERRRGLGRSLLRNAVAQARAARAHWLTLEVDQVNAPAICLYRSDRFGTVRRFREEGHWRLEMRRRLGTNSRS
jgi:ribosomal-protein-alanine N-acetyltransferase